MARCYITVSIPYVNASPHVGYALELVQADVLARWHRRRGDQVRFLGGTDDHALKNVLAAQACGLATAAFVDRTAERFAALRDPLAVSFDDFIRTSRDARHAPGVARLWRETAERGDFSRRWYDGEYCIGCEQFYADADLTDGCCPEHATPTERVAEENWFFALSRYRDELESLLTTNVLRIEPDGFRNEALAFIRRGLDDISVSRSVARARGWGLPVPDDPEQVVYVWWDALANYVTALGYGDGGPDAPLYRQWWLDADERVHVIGKGILRFHAVYWPALLLSAGAPPPTTLFVHPYLTADGRKLSKSSGVTVDPVTVVDVAGTDALRWWLTRDVARARDTDFTIERLIARANDDLANGLGNVTSRVTTLVHRFRGGIVPPAPDRCTGLDDIIASLPDRAGRAIEAFDFRTATAAILDAVTRVNQLIESTRPWDLARTERTDRRDGARLDALLAAFVDALRTVAAVSHPIVPDLAARIDEQLGAGTTTLPPAGAAFPRIIDR